MSKSNPVHLWRFGRTRALFLPQKSLNRAKTGVLNGTPKNFPGLGQGVLTIHKTQLARINWKIKSIFYGLATRGPYLKKKSDAKRPFFPPCRNWPIYWHNAQNHKNPRKRRPKSLHIWVSFCRAGKMAILCHFFLKSRAFVWPNLIR